MMKNKQMNFFILLRNFLTDYLVIRRNFSEKTVRTYRQSLKLLRNYFNDIKGIRFDQMDFLLLTRDSIYGFLLWLKDEKKNSTPTLNLRLSAIKSFLKYCSEEDLELTAVYLDIASIHAFKGTKKPCVDYLTQQQVKILFSVPNVTTRIGRRDRFFMIFAYETGGRMQELLDLKLSNIVRSNSSVRIRIHGKGDKIRYVPLLGETVKHLDAYLEEFHKESSVDDFLFFTIHISCHTQMQPGTVDHFLKKYGRLSQEINSNFPVGLHAHMLRHSIAMAMNKKGIPISYIRDFLGHSSIDTTTIYSYADEETITKALESVNQSIPGITLAEKQQKNWKGKEQYLIEFCGLK